MSYYIKVTLQTGQVKWVYYYNNETKEVGLTDYNAKSAALAFPDTDIGIIINCIIEKYHVAQITVE